MRAITVEELIEKLRDIPGFYHVYLDDSVGMTHDDVISRSGNISNPEPRCSLFPGCAKRFTED